MLLKADRNSVSSSCQVQVNKKKKKKEKIKDKQDLKRDLCIHLHPQGQDDPGLGGVFEVALHALQQGILGMHEAFAGASDKGTTLHRMETSQLDAICFTMYIATHGEYL